jgi:hypothetical protein
MPKTLSKKSTYEGASSRTARSFSLRQLPTDFFDIQAFIFMYICDLMSSQGRMVDEGIRFIEEMYTPSVRRMGLQIPCAQSLSWRD